MTKKTQAQTPDLTPAMLEMQAQLAQLKAELATLKGLTHPQPQPQPATEPKPKVSTTRRKLLRQLAGGLAAGLAVAGLGAATPDGAEAKITSNPTGNGLTGRVGMLVMPPGGSVFGTMGGVGGTKVGLLVTGDTSFTIPAVVAPTVNSAIIGYTSAGGTAIAGLSQSGIGVYGQADANFGVRGASTSSHGVYGSTSNTSQTPAAGVLGTATGAIDSGVHGSNNKGYGVYGESTDGYGVYGQSFTNHGVFGYTTNTGGGNLSAGVYGAAAVSGNYGVKGANNNGVAVYGETDSGFGVSGYSNSGYGIYGFCGQTGWAAYFNGRVNITTKLTVHEIAADIGNFNALGKLSGSFKIDHPLDPANKYLYHSFVESPDMMNIYNGIVTLDDQGEATVEMPDWFEALNFDFRYQLTCLGQFAPLYIAGEMKERKFKIAGGQPGQKVSWQVTGIRQDAWANDHRIQVEEDKTGDEKGKFLYPQGFGQPEEKSVRPRPSR